jgi:hypothetical protein
MWRNAGFEYRLYRYNPDVASSASINAAWCVSLYHAAAGTFRSILAIQSDDPLKTQITVKLTVKME